MNMAQRCTWHEYLQCTWYEDVHYLRGVLGMNKIEYLQCTWHKDILAMNMHNVHGMNMYST